MEEKRKKLSLFMFVFHNPQIGYMAKYKNVEEYQLTIDRNCLETTKTPMS
jgi:hypothetical protein